MDLLCLEGEVNLLNNGQEAMKLPQLHAQKAS